MNDNDIKAKEFAEFTETYTSIITELIVLGCEIITRGLHAPLDSATDTAIAYLRKCIDSKHPVP